MPMTKQLRVKAKTYVGGIVLEAACYIRELCLVLKVYFGVIRIIQPPQKVFEYIDE